MRLSICWAGREPQNHRLAPSCTRWKARRAKRSLKPKSLTKKFGDFAATDNVNFAVKRGEIFGLLGPNGAGKSTTFKMMCGLLVPTSGKALVLNMDLKVSSGKARQHLGYMAQKFSLYGNLTVEQNLRFFSGVYGLRGRAQNEKIGRMCDAFGLTEYRLTRHRRAAAWLQAAAGAGLLTDA